MLGLVRLRFKAPVHIGEAGLGLEETSAVLRSDTLYSSLFAAWLRLYQAPPPNLVLTSAYPFVGRKYYFPRPLLPLPGFTAELALKYGKALKRLRFVGHRHFFRWIKGESVDCEEMLADAALLEGVAATAVRPRVTLDRFKATSGLYFVGETCFDRTQKAGLFFLADLAAQDWPRLKAALKLLGEEGIGGRRSQGCGVFEPEFEEGFALEAPKEPDAWLTLSLFYPAGPEEVRDNLVAYHLVERTGWLEGAGGNVGVRHRRVLMFAEGSVFRRPVRGRLVDVAPEGFSSHPVYRNGRAFTIGVKTEGGSQ